MGGAPLGTLPLGSYGKWVLFCGDGQEVAVESLARSVLVKWERFFEEHDL